MPGRIRGLTSRMHAQKREAMRLVGASVAACLLGGGAAAAQSSDTLLQVVLVSRHGVRTPTIQPDVLSAWTAQQWPTWEEPFGHLTKHGKELATILGRYHRASLAAQGLLPSSGCPDPSSVYMYADVSERTDEMALGLLDGLAPGCGIPVLSKSPAKTDPVFHPVQGGVCQIDLLEAQTRILERVHGSFSTVVAEHGEAIGALQSALGCCKPDFCAAFGRPRTCTLPALPTAAFGLSQGQGAYMVGALDVASGASELFMLEYANGMSAGDVGWGKIGVAEIQRALELHDATFDLLYRTPYLARREGSSLLARVAGALTGLAFAGLAPPEPAVRGARFLAYIGHDTNIATLGGALDATWEMPGNPLNPTLPGGALMFERRRSADGHERVYVSYVAQTLEQMRSLAPLTLDAPPVRTPIRIPGCSASEPGYPCAIDDFTRVVREVLVPDCVARP
jgi:4-phytase/acid phosphatase